MSHSTVKHGAFDMKDGFNDFFVPDVTDIVCYLF